MGLLAAVSGSVIICYTIFAKLCRGIDIAALYETAFSGENKRVNIRLCFATGLAVLLVSAAGLFAGGSGLNVVVVVNQNSTNSVQLGNYYCEKRCVPPQNLLRITNWTGGNTNWTRRISKPILAQSLAGHAVQPRPHQSD